MNYQIPKDFNSPTIMKPNTWESNLIILEKIKIATQFWSIATFNALNNIVDEKYTKKEVSNHLLKIGSFNEKDIIYLHKLINDLSISYPKLDLTLNDFIEIIIISDKYTLEGISKVSIYELEDLLIKKREINSEPKELSEREEKWRNSFFKQALDYLNTLKVWENNQELATKISTYLKENNLTSEDIPKIYILLKKD